MIVLLKQFLLKIVDDNGNDLGNGVQINITTSTSYNDSPNQIYGEDLYLDIQGATIILNLLKLKLVEKEVLK